VAGLLHTHFGPPHASAFASSSSSASGSTSRARYSDGAHTQMYSVSGPWLDFDMEAAFVFLFVAVLVEAFLIRLLLRDESPVSGRSEPFTMCVVGAISSLRSASVRDRLARGMTTTHLRANGAALRRTRKCKPPESECQGERLQLGD